jgi:hypothetical protein
MRSCFSIVELERGAFAISGRGRQGMRVVHDLVDGIDGLALAGTATHIEDPGNQMVVHIPGIGEPLKFEFLPSNKARNTNGLATVAADDGTELT